jgi:hypothetical protein
MFMVGPIRDLLSSESKLARAVCYIEKWQGMVFLPDLVQDSINLLSSLDAMYKW